MNRGYYRTVSARAEAEIMWGASLLLHHDRLANVRKIITPEDLIEPKVAGLYRGMRRAPHPGELTSILASCEPGSPLTLQALAEFTDLTVLGEQALLDPVVGAIALRQASLRELLATIHASLSRDPGDHRLLRMLCGIHSEIECLDRQVVEARH